MVRGAVVIIGLVLPACAGGADPTVEADATGGSPPPTSVPGELVITEADHGQEFGLSSRATALLRLDSSWVWDEPTTDGETVELIRVDYLQDPGFSEWEVRAMAPGSVVIRSVGEPAAGSPEEPLEFEVTITVVA